MCDNDHWRASASHYCSHCCRETRFLRKNEHNWKLFLFTIWPMAFSKLKHHHLFSLITTHFMSTTAKKPLRLYIHKLNAILFLFFRTNGRFKLWTLRYLVFFKLTNPQSNNFITRNVLDESTRKARQHPLKKFVRAWRIVVWVIKLTFHLQCSQICQLLSSATSK
jgi:hypothetical protein